MNHLKITIVQKNLETGISSELKQKILSAKSDFLIFPSFFGIKSIEEKLLPSEEKKFLDKLLEISEFYKGVIIGGTILRQVNGKLIESCPIIQDIQLIDWYESTEPNKVFQSKLSKGESDKIFILGKLRFGLVLGNEILSESNLNLFKKEKIEILFNPSIVEKNLDQDYQSELDKFLSLSKEYKLNILRVTNFGKIQNREFYGRSFHSSASGIKWKVASSETNTEILKTLNITIEETLLSFKS